MNLVFLRLYLCWSLWTLYFWGRTSDGVYVPCISEDVPVMEFMYLEFLGCASGGVYVPCIPEAVPLAEVIYLAFLMMYLWWKICTLYFWGCASSGFYVPWPDSHARWELSTTTQVFVAFLWRLSSAITPLFPDFEDTNEDQRRERSSLITWATPTTEQLKQPWGKEAYTEWYQQNTCIKWQRFWTHREAIQRSH